MTSATLATIIVVAALLLVGLIYLLYRRYTKAGPNEVLVVSGRGKYRFVRGGTFVWPILERVQPLSLALLTLEVNASDAYTKQGVKLMVDGVAQVKIKSDPDSIRLAAEQFLGKPPEEIKRVALQVIDGYLRAILGTMSVEDVYLSRKEFASRVRASAQADLDTMGLQIVSLTIRHITDETGYLDALGRPRVAQVKRDAIIGEAKADEEAMAARYAADTAIAQARRDKEVKEAEFAAAVASVKAVSDLAYDLERFKRAQEVKRQEIAVQLVAKEQEIELEAKEIERKQRELEAEVMKPADAERYRIETLAQAERMRLETEAAGRAAGIRAEGLAEAEALKAKGLAEAEAMRQKAESWKQYNQAAVAEMFVGVLPKLASAVAQPLSKTEKIVVVGGNGAGTGVSKVTQDVAQVIAQLPTVVEGLTGVQLQELLRGVPGLATALAGGNGHAAEE
ncbi:MAG: SPFH domain-containing protein [Caldilineales bacterium]|nr:SPFH domain-containing protein [Caldilineales bacterium]MDW8319474.1 SPFH domain-containing protein [Anaerolineae bacterium]